MALLTGKVALVAGASRGLGRGIALALGEAGATVYITGRTRRRGDSVYPGSICETADQVNRLGGRCIPLYCDHTDDTSIAAALHRVRDEQRGLDILVNAVYPSPILPVNIPRSISGRTPQGTSFWRLPIGYWDQLIRGSLRACYVTIVFAMPLILAHRPGLIVALSSGGAVDYWFNVPYGVDKAGTEKMIANMAHDLRPYNVAAVALRPPLTKTELVLAGTAESNIDVKDARLPSYTGRAVVALAADPAVIAKSGKAFEVADLAVIYGFADTT